ncbi:hypothetical protein [Clostridium butyricum]|uniref:Lipoprotein n=1 Tax=Clostridium butyricum TaxID=1492 RepID=A0AAP9RFL6_CLOBU|nr:hypothetical protein [Clostridium butyricum]MBZ5746696.1 hypothetical protein [Clostridium butyricum]MCQ2018103.1 hypothetical protein [Clostridium butyricum]MCQ2023251.1 hypothetical protein [Clostridium butyricum]MDI9208371.1 hypothetical protein [Clostridium butyricum]NFB72963.1 hypothetical protein [Clostridium butyricum]
MKKKILSLLLCCIMCGGLIGCSSTKNDTKEENKDTTKVENEVDDNDENKETKDSDTIDLSKVKYNAEVQSVIDEYANKKGEDMTEAEKNEYCKKLIKANNGEIPATLFVSTNDKLTKTKLKYAKAAEKYTTIKIDENGEARRVINKGVTKEQMKEMGLAMADD